MKNKKKILLIEDDRMITDFVEEFIIEMGCDAPRIFTSGEDAVSFFTSGGYADLIITDITLAGDLDGIETSRQILAIRHIPIIYMSGDIHNEVIDTNPYGYLLKPFGFDHFRVSVQIALYRAQIEASMDAYQAHLKQAQALANMGSWVWNIETGVITWTDQIYRIFGLKPQQFEPTYPHFLERIHPDDREQVTNAVNDAVENHQAYDLEHRIVTPDNIVRYVHEVGDVSYDINNKPVRMIGSVIDITRQKELEQQLRHQAHHDALTGLPNRSLLLDRLELQIAIANRQSEKFALLYIDLDKFKPINDFYGHHAGDTVLKEVAKRLIDSTRTTDTVARIGGDEFIIILTAVTDSDSIKQLAKNLISKIGQIIHYQNTKLSITASIGFSIYPDDALTFNDLISKSDTAMYHAKSSKVESVYRITDLSE